MTALFSSPAEELDKKVYEYRAVGYYSILCLLAVGLLGMTSTGDVFNLYVFMEIVSLASYGLIAMGVDKAPIAAFRYLLMGTIGASMYLLGIGFLYAATVTLNMAASDYFVLVQTYSSDTAEDWNNGNKEYITEINRYSIEGQQGRSNMQLNIEVDENNTLILGINGATAEGTAPSRVDVNSISNQMSLWPLKMH